MNILPLAKRAQILHLLVEGNSMRATGRIAGVSPNTVDKLLCTVGKACYRHHDTHVRNLPTKRVQVDEVWSFVYAKNRNLPRRLKNRQGFGEVWTWTALDPDSKLLVCWEVGDRSELTGNMFLQDLASRLTQRVQLTSDGHKAYLDAVQWGFKGNIDYAIIMKDYGEDKHVNRGRFKKALGMSRVPVVGVPDEKHICTSHVERMNLTMRMGMRRFTRKTNAHSKKIENHAHALALHFVFYNFCRVHGSLRITPAMAVGLADHVWDLEDLLALA